MSKSLTIAFLIAGVLIGILFSTQFLSEVQIQNNHPSALIESRDELVNIYTKEQGILKNQITNLRTQIDQLHEKNAYFIPVEQLEQLDKIEKDLGLTEMIGSGIEIVLDDAKSVNRMNLDVNDDALIHAADLRDILNIIFASNVDGVSVNHQRIIYNSPTNCVGNTILVNNSNVLTPFTISVVTQNPDILLHTLLDEQLLFDIYRRKEDHGIQFKFRKNEVITLPVYNGNFKLNYLHTLNE